MKKNSIIKIFLFIIGLSLCNFSNLSYADDSTPSATFIISDGAVLLFDGPIALPSAGNVSILDIDGNSHTINSRSALAMIYQIDQANDSFSISNLKYYDSFGAFYLKCITPKNASEDCDNWEYTVNGVGPSTGLDSTLLSGGETVELYFGTPYHAPVIPAPAAFAVPFGSGPLVSNSLPIADSAIPKDNETQPLPSSSSVTVLPAVTIVPETIKPDKTADNIVKPKKPKSPSSVTVVKTEKILPVVKDVAPGVSVPLVATTEKSGSPAPLAITVAAIVFICGIVLLLRASKRPKK